MNVRRTGYDDSPLNVLLTIQSMERIAGGSLYVRDLAVELARQGHHPVVYCRRLGIISDQLIAAGVPVTDSLDKIAEPDVIHGNSPIESAAATLLFPQVPAIFVCHGWNSPDALAPNLPQILRYLAVSDISRDRLIYIDGIPEDRIAIHQNTVDLARFPRKAEIRLKPRNALVFSNNLSDENKLPKIREACEAEGTSLSIMGEASGSASIEPERTLHEFDLVFAKGRCALEALASGCSVIPCDELGLGEMINTENYELLRLRNFGRRTMRLTYDVPSIRAQIRCYDAADSALLTDHVRKTAGLVAATMNLVDTYRRVIREFEECPCDDPAVSLRAAAHFLESIAPHSNTFYLAERLEPFTQKLTTVEKQLSRFSEALVTGTLSRYQMRQVEISAPSIAPTITAGSSNRASLWVRNSSPRVLSSFGGNPVHLSYHWLDRNGRVVVFEGARTEMDPPLGAGRQLVYDIGVTAPDTPGDYILRLTLVQEGVAWFAQFGRYRDIECQVIPQP